MEYPNAKHAFDWPALAKPIRLANVQNGSHCQREEGADGNVVNKETGRTFTFKDACVERGATIAYDADAHSAAQNALRAFVIDIVGAN